jgi:hypothetical protein
MKLTRYCTIINSTVALAQKETDKFFPLEDYAMFGSVRTEAADVLEKTDL